MLTFDFPPSFVREIKGICIISYGKLACGTSRSSEQADFIFSIVSNAVAEARQRSVPENTYFLNGHEFALV